MTVALDRIERIGSTKARVYTPPLEEHCGPTGELTEEWSWGYDCIEFLEQVCGWHLLAWQRWLYIHALEKGAGQKGFRFKILVIMVARQNGKTKWLRGLGLWRLFMDKFGRASGDWPAARMAVIAAQNLDYAESMLKEVVDEVRDNPLLSPELLNHRETNGKHRMILTNRRNWRAATASRKGARSLSVDIAMLDELREHTTWDAWRAIVPTTTTRPYSQVVCASNAGDVRSEVLRAQRDACVRRIKNRETSETSMGFFEWSVPMEVDPHDPAYWYMANPSMGLLNDFTIDDLRGYLEAMEFRDMAGFQTEHLALDVETPVLTTGGWVTMGSLRVGDQVFHPYGHPVDVIRTTEVFDDRTCYEVVTTDGRHVVADADHRWMVKDRRSNRGWETLTTQQLLDRGVTRDRSGGRYAYRLPNQATIISKPVDLPLDPYVLGAWLGDGTASKPEITCVWKNKHVPDAYLVAGTEQRLALLQGLMDTDGSIDHANRVRFCNTNKQMAESVLYLARSLGQRATLVSSHGDTAYMVSFTASGIQPFRLPRKAALVHESFSRSGERTAISIKSITAVPARLTRCITVDSPDSLFLAGSGLIPTQNCQWVDALEPGIMPAEHWAETIDVNSRPLDDTPVVAAVDLNYMRTRGYIAVAARRADGNVHVEVVQADRGTDWIVPWFLATADGHDKPRVEEFTHIVIQKTGAPISGMIDEFTEAGIDVVEINSGVELAAAFGTLYDGICEHVIYHRPAAVLDRAAASAVARNSGESLVFDRRNSPVDASPLIACSLAAHIEANPPEVGNPTVHQWPDEDVIEQWQKEADELWENESKRAKEEQ